MPSNQPRQPARSRLETEIREQAAVLAARTAPGFEDARRAAELIRARDIDQLVIAARGSSDNAARYALYLLGSEARLPVALAAPWLYAGEAPPLLRGAAVLGISQSGRSPDIVGVLAAARAQGRPTIALTNDPGAPLAEVADVVMPLRAGEERSVAATKTYTASLHALAQLAERLRPAPGRLEWFERLPGLVASTVERQLCERERFATLGGAALVTVVARGLQFATAYETALKLRELSGSPAEAFSLPDLMHGPIAALREDGAVWLISTAARSRPDLGAFEELRRSTRLAVAVADDPGILAAADIAVPLAAGLPEWLAPILAVLPAQAAALALAERGGVDVDRPHGLSKVTLTR